MKIIRKIRFMAATLLFTGLFVIALYIFKQYESEKETINKHIDKLLISAVDKELEVRAVILKLNILIEHTNNNENILAYYNSNEQGKTEFSNNHEEGISLDERLKNFQQTNLFKKEAFINIAFLDSLFNQNLIKNSIPIEKTAVSIKYKQNIKNIFPTNDTSLFNHATYTAILKTGIFNEIEVKGYVKYDSLFIFKKITQRKSLIYLILLFFSILSLSLAATYMFQNKTKINNETKEDIPNPKIRKLSNNNYMLGELLLHTYECTLYKGSEKIKTPKREYELLIMFLTSPNYFITRESIILHFWSSKEECTDKLNTSISRLRRLLAIEPNLEITTERGVGYQLAHKESE